jgi:STE24 endopeptidase
MIKRSSLFTVLLLSASAFAQSAPDQYSLPPDKLAQATTLYHTELITFALGTVYSFAILWALLHFKVGVRIRDAAERASQKFFIRAVIVLPLILLAIQISRLPLSIFWHRLSLSYGLSVQRWGSWFADWCKGAAIEVVVGTFICLGVYWLMRRSTRLWWLWIWIISIPLTVFAVWIVPIVLDPIFNKFQPLEQTNPQLVQHLSRVAERGGLHIPPARMFEMKASEKVTTYNAYVTGVGSSKRIVVWDTTEREMSTPETLFIFGHEMGHYVLDHIWKGIAISTFLTIIGILLARALIHWVLRGRGERWGIRSIDDIAGLPLLLLVVSVITFLSMPIDSAISRYFEHQADVYGLEVTHNINANSPEVAASSFQKLGEKSLDYPYPNSFYVFWAYSHPTISDRLRFALRYRPWEQGRPTEFVK